MNIDSIVGAGLGLPYELPEIDLGGASPTPTKQLPGRASPTPTKNQIPGGARTTNTRQMQGRASPAPTDNHPSVEVY